MNIIWLVLFFLIGCNNEKEVTKYYQAGENFKNLGIYELAIKEYEKVIKESPKSQLAKSSSLQIDKCKKILEVKKEYEQIIKIKESNRPKEVVEKFNEFIQKYPNSPFILDAKYNQALCYEKLGDFDKAIKILEEISKDNQGAKLELKILKDDEENFKKARSLMKEKKYNEASVCLRSIKKKNINEANKLLGEIRNILEATLPKGINKTFYSKVVLPVKYKDVGEPQTVNFATPPDAKATYYDPKYKMIIVKPGDEWDEQKTTPAYGAFWLATSGDYPFDKPYPTINPPMNEQDAFINGFCYFWSTFKTGDSNVHIRGKVYNLSSIEKGNTFDEITNAAILREIFCNSPKFFKAVINSKNIREFVAILESWDWNLEDIKSKYNL